jgi:hypothetical protein
MLLTSGLDPLASPPHPAAAETLISRTVQKVESHNKIQCGQRHHVARQRVARQRRLEGRFASVIRYTRGEFSLATRRLLRSCRAIETASQSAQDPAIIWVHSQTSVTLTAAFSCVPEITDTEAVAPA